MRKMIMYAAPVILAVSASPAIAQEVINTPILTAANMDNNFRDIAGIPVSEGGSGLSYTTANGGAMRTGVFYRSSSLQNATPANVATLDTLGITELLDLRTPSEVTGAGSEVKNTPAGATYINVNVFASASPPSPTGAQLSSVAGGEQYLEGVNQAFVTNSAERVALGTVFADLANAPGPVIYNCSSGKDRTGWVSAMLQSIAGVSSANIMANYLATNVYSGATISTYAAFGPGIYTILGVQQPDLQAGLDQIIASYGSLDNYLIQGLGMTQAEIYVLRAKMVYYAMLPGQADMTGNGAQGAALLNALQNSPLSGHYTAYNYYLQSAIDAGSLGGVQNQVGGQVVADTESYLSRLPQLTNAAIAPDISGMGLADGQTKIWEANLAGILSTDSDSNVADSTSRSAGLMVGATHRLGAQVSIDAGLGYNWGSVSSAEGNAHADVFLTTLGARYAFSSLESGPFVSGGANADVVSVHEKRSLGGGLGQPSGDTNGAIYDGHIEIGDVIPREVVTFTPQLGFDVSNANLRSFTEQGSDLALHYDALNEIVPSLDASVEASMPAHQMGDWSISPTFSVGYVRLLSSPVVTSHGTVAGYTITDISAFNSRNLGTLGVDVSAQHGPISLNAGVTGVVGDANNSTGIAGRLGVTYKF